MASHGRQKYSVVYSKQIVRIIFAISVRHPTVAPNLQIILTRTSCDRWEFSVSRGRQSLARRSMARIPSSIDRQLAEMFSEVRATLMLISPWPRDLVWVVGD